MMLGVRRRLRLCSPRATSGSSLFRPEPISPTSATRFGASQRRPSQNGWPRRSGVLTLPGTVFGPGAVGEERGQDDFLRLAFANLEADRMDELGARLRAFA